MSEGSNAWSRVTCDMTDSEFCAWVRERCELSIRNTAAGVYMQGLIDRLMRSEAELLTAEQTGHKWFKLASDRRFEIERLQTENERLRAIIDKLTAKAPATASLAVFLCSKCRESVDTVYDVGSGANFQQLCKKCVQN